jgi:hypothetical protein
MQAPSYALAFLFSHLGRAQGWSEKPLRRDDLSHKLLGRILRGIT